MNKEEKHPGSLRIFFATEMWERYGFYVVQTLLALYLAKHFNWNDKDIYALVGSFTALTYASPVIGGWVADRLLGQKRSILTGGVILSLSYLILGLIPSDKVLIFSLAGIAVGTGLFKPNISSLLGNEYPENSPQRENGFTIFYMGITSGIILGCTFPNQLNYYFGWSFSFMSASAGMLLGLAVFIFGIKKYRINDFGIYEYQFGNMVKAILAIIGLWIVSLGILHYTKLADFSFSAIVLISAVYLIYSIKNASRYDARRIMVIGILSIISVIFWTFYFQMFLSFTLFLSRVVDQTLFGIQFPPPYYVSIQSFGAIVFGCFLARLKSKKPYTGMQSANKFLLSMLIMTTAFAALSMICRSSINTQLLSPLIFIPIYLMISWGELLLYPIGLSAVTVLAPRKKVSTMMGVFFVSLGVGGFLAGKLADLAAIAPGETDIIVLKTHYATAFAKISYLLFAALIIGMMLNRLIKYLLADSSMVSNVSPVMQNNPT